VRVQGGQQGPDVTRSGTEAHSPAEQLLLGQRAVEQVDHRGGVFVGQFDDHGVPWVDAELERARAPADAGEAR
jgi:hypothetical protein